MRKVFLLGFILFFLSFIISCGGGDGSSVNSISTNPSVSNSSPEVLASANPTADNVSGLLSDDALKSENATVLYVEGPTELTNSNCAYTVSEGGIIVCVPVSEEAKVDLSSTAETVDNVSEVVDNITTEEQNVNEKPYVISFLEKPVKKPICDYEKNMCLIFDLNGKYPDITVSLTLYKSLLAIPYQGKNIYQDGYVPIAGFSGDIGVEDSFGNRYGIKEINDLFQSKDVSVKIYMVLPYKSDLKDVFQSSNYKLYKLVIDNNTNKPVLEDINKDIKVVQYGQDNITLEAVLDGFYPFVLARIMDKDKKQIKSGVLENFPNTPITLYSCDAESTVDDLKNCTTIGYSLTSDNGSYQLIYEKPNDDKKLFVEIISPYLENKKVVIPFDELDNFAVNRNEETYPSFESLSETDKALLKSFIVNADEKQSYVPNINDLMYPDNFPENEFFVDNETVKQLMIEAIISFIEDNITVQNSKGEYYNIDEYNDNNTTKCSYNISQEDNILDILLTCVYEGKYSGENESYTQKNTDFKKLEIKKVNENKFELEYVYNFNYKNESSYTTDEGKIENYSETSTQEFSFDWNLNILDYNREISDFIGKDIDDYVSYDNGIKNSAYYENSVFNIVKGLGGEYYYIEKGYLKQSSNSYNSTSDFEFSKKYIYDENGNTIEVKGNLKGKFYNITFSGCNNGETSLSQNAIFNVVDIPDQTNFYKINGFEVDLNNVQNIEELCPSTQ